MRSLARGSNSLTATWARVRATSARKFPTEELIWQDPIPAVNHKLIDARDIAALKAKILTSGLSVSRVGFNRVGFGIHFPRLRQTRRRKRRPHPSCAAKRLGSQSTSPTAKGAKTSGRASKTTSTRAIRRKKVSLADLIVLAAVPAVEQAAKNAGHNITRAVHTGRSDASQEQTDVESFAVLEPSRMASAITSKANTPFRPKNC